LLRIWQGQTQARRVKKGLLERDDEILNLAAAIGNHLYPPQSLKRRCLTTAHSSKPCTRSTVSAVVMNRELGKLDAARLS
jgi:hypothetical protein